MNHGVQKHSSASTIAIVIAILLLASPAVWKPANAAEGSGLPDPAVDTPLAAKKGKVTAVVAGGCFWGVQTVFQHVTGAKDATSGYSGGSVTSPLYEQVSTGTTGHAESVKITFEPGANFLRATPQNLLLGGARPTQLNRQGPDTGTQYGSVIFYSDDDQKHIAEAYIAQLEQARLFLRPIVTQVMPLKSFYEAEAYHQDYARFHPDDAYIARDDAPKVEHLREQFPNFYKK